MNNSKRETSIAIDLGTTNCVCSYVQENGEIEIIPNKDGGLITPTFIHYERKGMKLKTTVGQKAKDMIETDPTNVVSSFKTFMGTNEVIKKVPVIGNINSVLCTYSMLKYLKESAEEFLERNLSSAIITVPAYFNENQKSATKAAAKAAGLEVEHIVNEPTAATFYYGLESSSGEPKTVLAYDLGGGTFDVSIIQVIEDNGVVLGTSGDNKLGGDDIDKIISQYILDVLKERILKADKNYEEKLIGISERAKIELCEKIDLGVGKDHSVTVNVPTKSTHEDESPEYVEVELSQETFENLIRQFLQRTLLSVDEAFKMSHLERCDIDEVILIGGSTKIPFIRKMLIDYLMIDKFNEDYFNQYQLNPDLAVGLGAGMFLKYLLENKLSNLTDIVSKSLGVADSEGQMIPLLVVGRILPISKSRVFVNSYDNQDEFNIMIYEGESSVAERNTHIGTINVPIRPSVKGSEQVLVRFSLRADGTLKVQAVAGNESVNVEIERDYDDSIDTSSLMTEDNGEGTGKIKSF